MERPTLPHAETTFHGNDAFSTFADLLIWLKGLALDPSSMNSSHRRARNQILRVRRLLNTSDANTPQRKRKFVQYINDGKCAGAFGLSTRDKSNNQNVKNQRRGQFFSLWHLLYLKENMINLQGKQGNVAFPHVNDTTDCVICKKDFSHLSNADESTDGPKSMKQRKQGNVAFPYGNDRTTCVICKEDFSHLSDTNESIEGPNPMKQGKLKGHYNDLVTSNGYTHNTLTSIKEKPNTKCLEVLKPLVIEDLDHSSVDLNQPLKFLQSWNKHIPRPVIPIGPSFQAEIPKWEGPIIKRHHISSDDLRWFGTQVWPMLDVIATTTKAVGKGKPESCLYDFRGSTDYIKQNVNEAGLLLQLDISTDFLSLKFDEIGHDVSKSWTLKDHKTVESLV